MNAAAAVTAAARASGASIRNRGRRPVAPRRATPQRVEDALMPFLLGQAKLREHIGAKRHQANQYGDGEKNRHQKPARATRHGLSPSPDYGRP